MEPIGLGESSPEKERTVYLKIGRKWRLHVFKCNKKREKNGKSRFILGGSTETDLSKGEET